MGDIQEAKQFIEQRKAEVDVAKQEQIAAEQKVSAANQQLSSQKVMRQYSGIEGLRQRQLAQSKIGSVQNQLSERSKQIQNYEQQLQPIETQISESERTQADYQQALRAFQDDSAFAVFTLENQQQQQFYRQLQEGKEQSIKDSIKNIENQVGATLTEDVRQDLFWTLREGIGKVSNQELNMKINTVLTSPVTTKIDTPVIEDKLYTSVYESDVAEGYTFSRDIPVVTAQTQNINTKGTTQGDGYNLSSGLYMGVSSGDSSQIQSGDLYSSLTSRFFSGSEKGFEEAQGKESYVPKAGFISASATGPGSTGIIRPPTQEEQLKISEAQFKGQFLSMPLKEVIEQSKMYSSMSFVGEVPKVGIGFGANKLPVSISSIDSTTKTGAVLSIITEYSRAVGEKIATGAGITEEGLLKISTKDSIVNVPIKGTIPYDNLGKPIETRQIDIPGRDYNIITPSQVGSLFATASYGRYFIPGVWYAEQGGKVGELVKTQGGIKGTVSYFKNYPIEATITTASLALKGYGFLTKPTGKVFAEGVSRTVVKGEGGVEVVIETSPRNTLMFQEDVIVPVVKGEKQTAISKFKLTVDQPGQVAEKGNRLRDLFFSREQVVVRNPRVDTFLTTNPIVTDTSGKIINEVFVGGRRDGAKLTKVFRYEGVSQNIDAEAFSKLPDLTKFEFQKMAELKAGIPVSMENVPLVLGRNFEYSTGGLVTTKVFRYGEGGKNVRFYDIGKRTVYSDIVSTAKPIISTDEFTIYKTKSGVKSSISANPRASGDISIIKGYSKVYKPVVIEDAGTSEIINLGKDTKGSSMLELKKPVSVLKTQETINQIVTDLAKNVPKNVPTKAGKEVLESLGQSESNIPKMVGGKGIAVSSDYAGTGQYEVTSQTSSLLPVVQERSLVSTALEDKQIQPEILKTPQIEVSKNIKKQFDIINQKNSPAETNKLSEVQKVGLNLKQAQAVVLKQSEKTTQTTRTTRTPQSRPIPIVPSNPKIVKSIKLKLAQARQGKQAFDVISFKGGKPITIAKGLPEGLATKAGSEFVKKTLRASFKLVPKGETSQEDIRFNIDKNVFRPSKRDSNRLVQVARSRLSSGTEVSEIQFAKRRKGGRRSKSIF